VRQPVQRSSRSIRAPSGRARPSSRRSRRRRWRFEVAPTSHFLSNRFGTEMLPTFCMSGLWLEAVCLGESGIPSGLLPQNGREFLRRRAPHQLSQGGDTARYVGIIDDLTHVARNSVAQLPGHALVRNRPSPPITRNSGAPASRVVGTSGAAGDRLSLATQSSFSLPAWTCASTIDSGITAKI